VPTIAVDRIISSLTSMPAKASEAPSPAMSVYRREDIMDEGQPHTLEQQVSQVLAERQAAGARLSAERVARQRSRRMADVLPIYRRLKAWVQGPSAPNADTAPEADPEVVTAQVRVAQLTAAVAAAATAAEAAERAYAQAEAVAAEAVADGQVPPIDLADAWQRALAASERAHWLGGALQKAKTRHAEALDGARRAHKIRRWGAYQAAVKALIESDDAFAMAQAEVLRCWNACGQPGEAPRFQGTVEGWRENFRSLLVQLTQMPADEVPPYPQPRAY
jgi:hypothetical protein